MTNEALTPSQIQQWVGTLADAANNFVNGFSEAYHNSYDAAIAAGRAPFEAEIAGLESGIRANSYYAELNAQRFAANPDLSFSQTFQNLADHYSSIADNAGAMMPLVKVQLLFL
ncbi:hypothetical protein FZ025_20305 [Xanthomonas hyacinthi]|uniref:hypothetical protein n=1 Tax=Xanthomonas hyacinthi TaxID=56455 RepID=UPI0011B0EA7C|nr:hypothetical protein [Xanthomonas hyacinthi]QGY78856.1 hypothetical protein FZ025_20305 [Xanthomonas hyacinthi]